MRAPTMQGGKSGSALTGVLMPKWSSKQPKAGKPSAALTQVIVSVRVTPIGPNTIPEIGDHRNWYRCHRPALPSLLKTTHPAGTPTSKYQHNIAVHGARPTGKQSTNAARKRMLISSSIAHPGAWQTKRAKSAN